MLELFQGLLELCDFIFLFLVAIILGSSGLVEIGFKANKLSTQT